MACSARFPDPVMVLFEYIPFGDLLGYLRRSRGLSDNYYKDPDVKPSSSLSSKQLLKFSRGGTILCTILFHLEVANPIQCKVHPFDAVNDPFTVQ